MEDLSVRASEPGDTKAIVAMYPLAFPEEDLVPLVKELLADSRIAMSLVGTLGSEVVGHAVFTRCGIQGANVSAALLGPVAVTPTAQKQGVGSGMIRHGLQLLANENVNTVLVLGDPAYYQRFGFLPDSRIAAPYPLPEEWRDAWQSMALGDGEAVPAGKLEVPDLWRQPALWGP